MGELLCLGEMKKHLQWKCKNANTLLLVTKLLQPWGSQGPPGSDGSSAASPPSSRHDPDHHQRLPGDERPPPPLALNRPLTPGDGSREKLTYAVTGAPSAPGAGPRLQDRLSPTLARSPADPRPQPKAGLGGPRAGNWAQREAAGAALLGGTAPPRSRSAKRAPGPSAPRPARDRVRAPAPRPDPPGCGPRYRFPALPTVAREAEPLYRTHRTPRREKGRTPPPGH
nr:uncharacterized protein LOC111749626 [Loxodonta africana]